MPPADNKMDYVKAVQEKYEEALLAKEHVVGVSIGQEQGDEFAIVVLVDRDAPRSSSDQIPHELDGIPVVVRHIGKLEASYQAKRQEAGWD